MIPSAFRFNPVTGNNKKRSRIAPERSECVEWCDDCRMAYSLSWAGFRASASALTAVTLGVTFSADLPNLDSRSRSIAELNALTVSSCCFS